MSDTKPDWRRASGALPIAPGEIDAAVRHMRGDYSAEMAELAQLRAQLRWWRIGSLIAALTMLAGCVALRLA